MSMGWTNSHLHESLVGKERYGISDLLDILLDRIQEEFRQLSEWTGNEFNAEVISLKDINLCSRRNRCLSAKS